MSKPTVLWTATAIEDLARIWTENPQHRDELALIRPSLERRLTEDPVGFALEEHPDASAVGIEPRPALAMGANVAIGVLCVVSERKVLRVWIYIKPAYRRRRRKRGT